MAARVTKVGIEALVQPTTQKIRVTKVGVEALVQPSTRKIRVTKVAIQVLINVWNTSYEDALSFSENIELSLLDTSGLTKVASDTIDNFSDAIEVLLLGASDQIVITSDSLAFSDAFIKNLQIITVDIPLSFSDEIEVIESEFSLFKAGDIDVEILHNQRIQFKDRIQVSEGLPVSGPLDFGDTLNLSDAASFNRSGAIESFDTIFYEWADGANIVLEIQLAVSDTLVFVEEASISYTIVGITKTANDTLVLSDAMSYSGGSALSIIANFTLADGVVVAGTSRMNQSDTLSLSDATNLSLLISDTTMSDAMSLTDNITISLSALLTATAADSLASSWNDVVGTNKRSTNTGYLRRYLNDVVN